MTALTRAILCASALLWSAAAFAAEPEAQALAPSGTLRAAINLGNPVLAQRGPAAGEPRGVSAELARALAQRLGVPVRFVIFDEAGEVAAAAAKDAWDVAFLAIDPVRAATIAYTAPYVLIEGVYAVPATSPLDSVEGVDRPGVRICVAERSAYDLYLTRALKQAQLVRLPNGARSEAAFLAGQCETIAGVKQPVQALVRAHPGLRLVPGRFMAIQQAMVVPKAHEAGLAFLRAFVEQAKASGMVRKALDASGQPDAEVAPPE